MSVKSKTIKPNIYPVSHIYIGLILVLILACSTDKKMCSNIDLPSQESYTYLIGGTEVGYLNVSRLGDTLKTDFDYKNNGRGPTIQETIILDANLYPIQWDIAGTSTFGNAIDEHFKQDGSNVSWIDASGSGNSTIDKPSIYINQFGSPYSNFIQAQVLLHAKNQSLPALPSGQLQLTEIESLSLALDTTEIKLLTYEINGAGLNPSYLVMDENNQFFAAMDTRSILIRSGFEEVEERIRSLSENYSKERLQNLQQQYANIYKEGVMIRNVKIFSPKTMSLSEPPYVIVRDERIVEVGKIDIVVDEVETIIEGECGVLVPGLYDMHAHIGENAALLNILASVTSVRDMGSHNEVLDSLIQKIEAGIIAGPRITRLGLIEGKSPFNNNKGILVASEEEALAAIDTYAKNDYHGIKIYNSIDGNWAPNMVKRAHELGMFVTGHVPAFSNANTMIRAGFDEMTHMNQVMLGWVLQPNEDTRTLLRLTAMKRFPYLSVNSIEVSETLDLMTSNKVAIDPTLAIHESLMLSRNGEFQPGMLDYISNMPTNIQRNAIVARINIADEKEDRLYRLAFDKILEILKIMKDRGILIVPGTDMGGAFNLHRELELYLRLGFTSAELLKLATYDMAQYLGYDDRGLLEPGMLADFFLVPGDPTQDIKAIKTISMVSRGGVIYFPSDIYPSFGIIPLIEKPEVRSN